MRLCSDPIEPGSRVVRIWLNAEPGKGWPRGKYDAVCNINRLNERECEISPCLGNLTISAIRELAKECKSFEYRIMHFRVERGTKLGRIAKFVKTFDGMDYYMFDLSLLEDR